MRSKGYKAAPQRTAICRIVLSSSEHPSAQQVYDRVKKIHPTVNKTMEVLRDLNLVQGLDFSRGQARFGSYMNPHINLVCSKCGAISDLDDSASMEIAQEVAAATNFQPSGHRLDLYGTCQKCSKTV